MGLSKWMGYVTGKLAEHPAAATPPPPAKTDNDEEDKENLKIQKMGSRGKRLSVSSERYDTKEIDSYQKPVFEKDSAAKERIAKVLRENSKMKVIFGNLLGQDLDDVINAFQLWPSLKGVDIIRQGDDGDRLYIIDEGEVDVFVKKPAQDGQTDEGKGPKVTSLGVGALFGELALMYSAPRAATVTVASDTVTCWALERDHMKKMMVKAATDQYALYESWLRQVDIFKTLDQSELAKVSDVLKKQTFQAGQAIITQGEAGQCFYVLETGSCAAYLVRGTDEEEVKRYEQQGDYFGELALINDEPRKATVRAIGNGATVAAVTRHDFEKILGPIRAKFERQAQQYAPLNKENEQPAAKEQYGSYPRTKESKALGIVDPNENRIVREGLFSL